MRGAGFEVVLFEEGARDSSMHLRRMAENAEASERFFREVGDILIEAERRRWARSGPGWDRLAWATVKKKARSKDPRVKANAGRVLRATGALERALTVWGAPGQKWRTTSTYAVFGIETGGQKRGGIRVADVWYGAIPQKGNRREPQRVILKVTPATKRKIVDALREQILGADAGPGGPL